MEKEFVPYEQALALRELGFDDKTFKSYDTSVVLVNGKYLLDNWYDVSTVDEVKAPLYQQAFRWFRENYKLWSMIYPRDGWNYAIQRIDETTSCTEESFHGVEINLYEEAELECLTKLIEVVKNK